MKAGTREETTLMLTDRPFACVSCRAYAERIGFYLQRIFTCEATGRQGLDYYSAMNSELKESTSVHQRFPPALKPKVLASAHYCEFLFFACEAFTERRNLFQL